METAKLFKDDVTNAYPFMAAIEMIHTYSWYMMIYLQWIMMNIVVAKKLHMRSMGEDLGILAGDGLLNMAYEIMSQAVIKSDEPMKAAEAMGVIAKKAGVYGMVGGQTVDVINENKKMDMDTIMYIHNLKTAALIEASMMQVQFLQGQMKLRF